MASNLGKAVSFDDVFNIDAQSPLDTNIDIITPENIAFSYRLAGPFRRLPAYLIDMAVIIVSMGILGLVFFFTFGIAGLGGFGLGIYFILLFIVQWFYFGLFETFWNGQTIGKWLTGIRVVTEHGQPINASQAILRNILRPADAFPVLSFPHPLLRYIVTYQVAFFVAALTRRFQRVGDYVCGTMVIAEQQGWMRSNVRFTDPVVHRFANEQIPAGFRASPSLTRAIALYVERRRFLSMPRRMEIAQHVGKPLMERFGLPLNTNPDLLLCALYHRAFHQETTAPGSGPEVARSPFEGHRS